VNHNVTIDSSHDTWYTRYTEVGPTGAPQSEHLTLEV